MHLSLVVVIFSSRDWGNCLDDEPSDHEFYFPELPPGAMYDADHQCRLQYGPDAEHCEGIEVFESIIFNIDLILIDVLQY